MPGLPGLALLLCLGAPRPKPIDGPEAVRRAEAFVRAQGYTDSPPTADLRHLVPESLEFSTSPRSWLAQRYRTLPRRAYGYLHGRRGGPGWTVVFLPTGVSHPDTGRAVTLDPDGGNIQVEHVDVFLWAVETRL